MNVGAGECRGHIPHFTTLYVNYPFVDCRVTLVCLRGCPYIYAFPFKNASYVHERWCLLLSSTACHIATAAYPMLFIVVD